MPFSLLSGLRFISAISVLMLLSSCFGDVGIAQKTTAHNTPEINDSGTGTTGSTTGTTTGSTTGTTTGSTTGTTTGSTTGTTTGSTTGTTTGSTTGTTTGSTTGTTTGSTTGTTTGSTTGTTTGSTTNGTGTGGGATLSSYNAGTGPVIVGRKTSLDIEIWNRTTGTASNIQIQVPTAPFLLQSEQPSDQCGVAPYDHLSPNTSCHLSLSVATDKVGIATGFLYLTYNDGSMVQPAYLGLTAVVADAVQITTPGNTQYPGSFSVSALTPGTNGANAVPSSPPPAPIFAFGSVHVQTSAETSLVLVNLSTTTVTLSPPTLAAPLSYQGGTYPGTNGTCGTELAFEASCSLDVIFSPTQGVDYQMQVAETYSLQNTNFKTSPVVLTGHGLDCAAAGFGRQGIADPMTAAAYGGPSSLPGTSVSFSTNHLGRGLALGTDGSITLGNRLLARFTCDGLIDRSFGTGGAVADDYEVTDVALAGNKIVAVGLTREPLPRAVIARYLSNGSLDPDFGEKGKVIDAFNYTGGTVLTSVTYDGSKIWFAGWGVNDSQSSEFIIGSTDGASAKLSSTYFNVPMSAPTFQFKAFSVAYSAKLAGVIASGVANGKPALAYATSKAFVPHGTIIPNLDAEIRDAIEGPDGNVWAAVNMLAGLSTPELIEVDQNWVSGSASAVATVPASLATDSRGRLLGLFNGASTLFGVGTYYPQASTTISGFGGAVAYSAPGTHPVSTNSPFGTNPSEGARGIAQPDGRLLILGTVAGMPVIARLKTDGSLDLP